MVVAVGDDECADVFDNVVLGFVAAVSVFTAIFDIAVVVVVSATFAVIAVGDNDCVDGFDVVVLCCFDAAVVGDAGFDIVVLVFAAIFVVGTAV